MQQPEAGAAESGGYATDHQLVFIGGLHRSGTTLLGRCLAQHPDVSGFEQTGVKEDEGQHLQDVYPPARQFGGPGRFARAPGAHLTEHSPLATADSARRLLAQWRPHWDLDRPVLVEKTPSNLISTRFLQALVPSATFVMIVRHPVVVSLSTRKWTHGVPLRRLFEHWFHAHTTLLADAAQIRRLHVLTYEDLVLDPTPTLAGVADFLGLSGPVPSTLIRTDRSDRYEGQWRQMATSRRPWERLQHGLLCRRFGQDARRFGYDMHDLGVRDVRAWSS